MQQLLSAYHGPHIPLDIAGSYEWFLKKPRSLLPGCPQALLSRGGWWLWGTGGHKLGRKGQLLLSPSQLLPRGNKGPVSPGQLVFPEKLEIKIFFLPEISPFKKLSTNSKFLKTLCGPTNVQAKSNKSAGLIWPAAGQFVPSALH